MKKVRTYKSPIRAIDGTLCADIYTMINYALSSEKCRELSEFFNNGYYSVNGVI
jgi:hypothetical protein